MLKLAWICLHLMQTLLPMIWLLTEGEWFKSRLPFKIFSSLKYDNGQPFKGGRKPFADIWYVPCSLSFFSQLHYEMESLLFQFCIVAVRSHLQKTYLQIVGFLSRGNEWRQFWMQLCVCFPGCNHCTVVLARYWYIPQFYLQLFYKATLSFTLKIQIVNGSLF